MASTLDPLAPSESEAMLRHRWLIAGGKTFPFQDDALNQLYTHSQGIPRTRSSWPTMPCLARFCRDSDPLTPP